MCSGSSFGRLLTARDREVLVALSNVPIAGDFLSVGELTEATEGSIKSGLILMSLRELIVGGLAESSEIGWRWRLTDRGRQAVNRVVAEAMNTKGADEGRPL